MFRLELDVQDLADARFAISPLHEAMNSLWVVYAGWARPLHGTWAARVRACPGLDHELLASLVSTRRWIPDFVAPPPAVRPSIAGQLRQVRQTPPDKVISDILAAYGSAPLPRRLRGLANDADVLRDQIADALERYWDLAIAPAWPRAVRLLEADVLHRGVSLAGDGPCVAFSALDRRIRWDGRALSVDIVSSWRRELPVAGRGLRFIPSVFTPHPNLPIDTVDPPVLTYPARASATMWHAPLPPSAPSTSAPRRPAPRPPALQPSAATTALLGASRARLLAHLGTPASTTSLAANLGVTPSAVSQHLRVLADAGLVAGTRVGRVVLYQRTDLGARLTLGT
jgi:DNA-binding transcriptional ArsR family regulator